MQQNRNESRELNSSRYTRQVRKISGWSQVKGRSPIVFSSILKEKYARCTCPDYQIMVKSDGDYKCKHLLAAAEAINNNDTESAAQIKKMKPKLDEKFIINIKGKDFCTYPGLLDVAHKLNLMSLNVELLQYPSKDNGHEAITKAVAETTRGEVYTDLGDAAYSEYFCVIKTAVLFKW